MYKRKVKHNSDNTITRIASKWWEEDMPWQIPRALECHIFQGLILRRIGKAMFSYATTGAGI